MSKKAAAYLSLTLAGLLVLWALYSFEKLSSHWLVLIILPLFFWMPGLTALLTQLLFTHGLGGLGWRFGESHWLRLALDIPILYSLAIYGFVALTGLGDFPSPALASYLGLNQTVESFDLGWLSVGAPSALGWVGVGIISVLVACVSLPISLLVVLVPVIGWNGLLAPELVRRIGFTPAAFLTGLLWLAQAILSIVLLCQADLVTVMVPGQHGWYSLVCGAISITGMSFVLTWLRLRSGSFWPAAVLLASHFVFYDTIAKSFVADTGVTGYIAGDSGAGLAMIAVILAVLFWLKRGELSLEKSATIPIVPAQTQ